MKTHIRPLALFVLLFGGALLAPPAHAQFWDRIKDAAKDAAGDAVEGEVRDKSADAVHGAFDVAENAVKCAVTDNACIEQAKKQGKPVAVTDAEGNVVKQIPAAGAQAAQGVGAVNANYDFKPGERTIFADDFSDDNVGDFPRSLEFVEGNMSVVQTQEGRLLRSTDQGVFRIILPEVLPERFTVEFDLMIGGAFSGGAYVLTRSFDGPPRDQDESYFRFTRKKIGVEGEPSSLSATDAIYELSSVEIMVDGGYAKVYVAGQRVANIPNASFARTGTLQFYLTGSTEEPSYIGNIRVAGGGRDLYSALESEGRVAVQDILFDTGKATIQPASAEALQEIATVLTEHADLRLLVEGHTDNEGGFETNMALSKERAAAVKTYLVQNHGIAAERLKTIGLGATQPAASNDTEAGRAENRRVELVRL